MSNLPQDRLVEASVDRRCTRTLGVFVLFVLIIVFLGCTRAEQAGVQGTPSDELVVGFSYFQDTMLPLVAEWEGWYEAEGLNVRLVALDWAAIPAAIGSGEVDLAIGNICAVIGAYAQMPDLRYVYGFNTFDNGFALMVRPGAGWTFVHEFEQEGLSHEEAIKRTAAQLEGTTVVTTSGTDMEQGVAAAAESAGLRLAEDVQILDFDPDEGLAAFLGGEGDAFIGGIPQRLRAQQEGMQELLTGTDLGPAPINGYLATESVYEARKQEVLALIRLWFKTVQFVEHDPEIAGRLVDELNANSGGNFSIDDFWRFFNNIEHYQRDPLAVQQEIIDKAGTNHWRARWDSCNHYFTDVVDSQSDLHIPAPVPYTASLIERVQSELGARFGYRIIYYPESVF